MNDFIVDIFNNYHHAVYAKNLFIGLGFFCVGFLAAFMLFAWMTRISRYDRDMDVKIMRIKQGKKRLYVGNPRNISELLQSFLIMVLWELRAPSLKNRNAIYYEDARLSKFTVHILVIISIVFVIIAIYLTFTSMNSGMVHND